MPFLPIPAHNPVPNNDIREDQKSFGCMPFFGKGATGQVADSTTAYQLEIQLSRGAF